jgi:MarR family transcriptional repressor of emrRAB
MPPTDRRTESIHQEPLSAPAAWAEYLALTGGVSDTSSLPHRFLVQIAHQASIGDPDCCATIASVLVTSRSMRRVIERAMARRGFSESRMATLLTLYAMAPVSSNATDLAYHADVTRSSMTQILDVLEKRGWIARESGGEDRRSTPVCITEKGKEATTEAVHQFLSLAASLAGHLTFPERQLAVRVCDRLHRHAVRLAKSSVEPPSS